MKENKMKLTREEERFFIDFVAKIALWVHPKIVAEVPVIYPKTRRKSGVKEKRNTIVDGLRVWDNQPARYALRLALDHKNVKGMHALHFPRLLCIR